jgi:hypothetical protein
MKSTIQTMKDEDTCFEVFKILSEFNFTGQGQDSSSEVSSQVSNKENSTVYDLQSVDPSNQEQEKTTNVAPVLTQPPIVQPTQVEPPN